MPRPSPRAPTRQSLPESARPTPRSSPRGSSSPAGPPGSRRSATSFRLDPAQLGLVLLAIAAGSLVSLPLSGTAVGRYGSRRTVTFMAVVNAASLGVIAFGYLVGVVPLVIGLFVLRLRQGAWDVAMNVQGAVVERRLGRAIMSRFHAGFSVGTVAGALVGAAMVALGRPGHGCTWRGRRADRRRRAARRPGLPARHRRRPTATDRQAGGRAGGALARLAGAAHPADRAVRARLRLRRGHRQRLDERRRSSTATAPRPRSARSASPRSSRAMTVGRWFGPGLLDRYGRVVVVRALALLGVGRGACCSSSAACTPMAFVGAVLWGLGLSRSASRSG